MKFFEAVPGELFSPLASPNRALYADALDVLYTAYRENLKIREDTLYSMLRSRLEQQLADATFEGEDIDEDELRDISGRARFLIRKLCGKGWFEKERGDDFEEYITVPSYSSRLLELFHQLRDDRLAGLPGGIIQIVHQNDVTIFYLLKHCLDRLGRVPGLPVQRINTPENRRHGNRACNVHAFHGLCAAAGTHQHRRDAAGIGNHLVCRHQLICQLHRCHLCHEGMVVGVVSHLAALSHHLF